MSFSTETYFEHYFSSDCFLVTDIATNPRNKSLMNATLYNLYRVELSYCFTNVLCCFQNSIYGGSVQYQQPKLFPTFVVSAPMQQLNTYPSSRKPSAFTTLATTVNPHGKYWTFCNNRTIMDRHYRYQNLLAISNNRKRSKT